MKNTLKVKYLENAFNLNEVERNDSNRTLVPVTKNALEFPCLIVFSTQEIPKLASIPAPKQNRVLLNGHDKQWSVLELLTIAEIVIVGVKCLNVLVCEE